MLAVLCSGLFAPKEDTEGNVFIDWDPSHFGAVLTYLREGPVAAVQAVGEGGRGLLRRELRYYGLPDLLPIRPLFPPSLLYPLNE